MPYLLAYSLGDGSGGAEAGEAAVLAMIEAHVLLPVSQLRR